MAGKRWNGSSWTDHATKKRWNGSSWVDLTIAKRWNGSSWVDIYAGGGGGSLTFTPSQFTLEYFHYCNATPGPCVISIDVSDSLTYSVTGNTGAYTVVATNYVGDVITVDDDTPGTITASTTLGRNSTKSGEIKIVVTDTVTSVTSYIPYIFDYTWDAPEGDG